MALSRVCVTNDAFVLMQVLAAGAGLTFHASVTPSARIRDGHWHVPQTPTTVSMVPRDLRRLFKQYAFNTSAAWLLDASTTARLLQVLTITSCLVCIASILLTYVGGRLIKVPVALHASD